MARRQARETMDLPRLMCRSGDRDVYSDLLEQQSQPEFESCVRDGLGYKWHDDGRLRLRLRVLLKKVENRFWDIFLGT